MEDLGLLTLLPPLLAIFLALWTRRILPSLFIGIWAGWVVEARGDVLSGLELTLNDCLSLLRDKSSVQVVLFCIFVGALMKLIERSGGINGFINLLSKLPFLRTARSSQLLLMGVGALLFIESNISLLVTGAVGRPLAQKFQFSKAKLAYLCDATSAPICILIPINAWGAFIVGLLSTQGVERPVHVLIQSIGFNFYPMIALGILLLSIISGTAIGPMRNYTDTQSELTPTTPQKTGNAWYMILPLSVLVIAMPAGLIISGNGNILEGSGSTAVFWAVLLAILSSSLLLTLQKQFTLRSICKIGWEGMVELFPVGVLMLLAFALGSICEELGTGRYVVHFVNDTLPRASIIPLVFLLSCVAAFATGTSWGTFATMIPIAVPLASELQLDLPLVLGAALGGGVFGDHCSPISDTSVVASLASGCNHVDHVRTQIPYAVIAATIALALYAAISCFKM